MLIGLGVFGLGSAMAALAPSVTVLMCRRRAEWGSAPPSCCRRRWRTLARLEPGTARAAMALWSASTGIGGVLGNLGGGLAVEAGGWRALSGPACRSRWAPPR